MIARVGEHPASLLIVLLIFVVLFGWKRLPDASRSLGRSLRIFKTEVSELKNDEPIKDEPVKVNNGYHWPEDDYVPKEDVRGSNAAAEGAATGATISGQRMI